MHGSSRGPEYHYRISAILEFIKTCKRSGPDQWCENGTCPRVLPVLTRDLASWPWLPALPGLSGGNQSGRDSPSVPFAAKISWSCAACNAGLVSAACHKPPTLHRIAILRHRALQYLVHVVQITLLAGFYKLDSFG